MFSRWALLLGCVALFSAGCCCDPCAGRGGRCGGIFSGRSYESRMAGGCDNCGSCATTVGCANGGIKGWIHNNNTCCKGCGGMYWGEWISDPPDCCDPCDGCGSFTGYGGTCCHRGCLARIARLFHGYRYCPGECVGNGCGLGALFCCNRCGGAGCDACGGEGGLDGMYEGEVHHGSVHHGSVLNENWDPPPPPKPTPGKPIHKADTPHSIKVGSRPLSPSLQGMLQAGYQQ